MENESLAEEIIPDEESQGEETGEESQTGTDTEEEQNPIDDPNHPRFKQIYGKMKSFERKLEESELGMEALRKHNASLQSAVTNMETSIEEDNRPDPIDDPDAFADWIFQKAKREMSQNTFDSQEEKTTPTPNRNRAPNGNNFNIQQEVMREIHSDYDEVVSMVNGDMEGDSVLRNDIWNSSNPAKRAYEYGKQRMDMKKGNRSRDTQQSYVEGGTPPVAKSGNKPTGEQIQMAKNMGVPIKDYMKQVAIINKGGK